MCEINCYLW